MLDSTHAPRAHAYTPVSAVKPRPSLAYSLSEAERREYFDRGFVIVRGMVGPDDVIQMRAEVDRIVAEADQRKENMRFWQPGDKTEGAIPWKVDPSVDLSTSFSRLVRDRRITDRVASLYDGYSPRLFKDKLIIKPAGSHGNDKHQDYNWWQGFPKSLLSVSIAIDETTRENGCTEFWTGWQKGFRHTAGTQDGAFDATGLDDEEHVYGELAPGDGVIFNCMTPHAAGPNTSSEPRRAIFLTYNDGRDGEHYAAHYEHFYSYIARSIDPEIRAHYFWE